MAHDDINDVELPVCGQRVADAITERFASGEHRRREHFDSINDRGIAVSTAYHVASVTPECRCSCLGVRQLGRNMQFSVDVAAMRSLTILAVVLSVVLVALPQAPCAIAQKLERSRRFVSRRVVDRDARADCTRSVGRRRNHEWRSRCGCPIERFMEEL